LRRESVAHVVVIAAFVALVALVFGGAIVLDATAGDSHHGDVILTL
jgi:hypothetical protein